MSPEYEKDAEAHLLIRENAVTASLSESIEILTLKRRAWLGSVQIINLSQRQNTTKALQMQSRFR